MENTDFNKKCINCSSPAEELHHVVPLSLGGKDIESNKVWLCSRCHALIHGTNIEHRGVYWKRLQAAGIKKAQEKGVKFGRPQAQKPDNWTQVYKRWKDGEITAVKAMELTNLTKSTFYKYVKIWIDNNQYKEED